MTHVVLVLVYSVHVTSSAKLISGLVGVLGDYVMNKHH